METQNKISYRKNCFWIVTARTKNKFFDENVKHLLQLNGLVGAVYNKAVGLDIKLSLSTKFTAKKLGGI